MPTITKLSATQREILDLLNQGRNVREIAEIRGVTTNAVHLQIQKLRDRGALPQDFTASGRPPREMRELRSPGRDDLEYLTRPEGDEYVHELARVHDDLVAIARRISLLLPR